MEMPFVLAAASKRMYCSQIPKKTLAFASLLSKHGSFRATSSFANSRHPTSCPAFGFAASTSTHGNSYLGSTCRRFYQSKKQRVQSDTFSGHRYGRKEVEIFSHLEDDGDLLSMPRKQSANKKKKKKKKGLESLYRADRVLANRSGRTRSECFKLLQRKAISILEESDVAADYQEAIDTENSDKVRVVRGPKEKIPMNARIWINHKFEVPPLAPLLTVYHKPKWVLSTMGVDSKERRNLEGLSFPYSNQMHPVGRLDYDSSGLLLFSSSGPLTQALLHPKYEKEKEYLVTVTGTVEEETLKERLQEGVELVDVSKSTGKKINNHDDNDSEDDSSDAAQSSAPKPKFVVKAELLEVVSVPSSEVAPYLEDIRRNLPSEYNVTDLKMRGFLDVLEAKELSQVRLVVSEGKHRMVRRMLATCGHPVVSLKRERMGAITLGDLEEGALRNLTRKEEKWAQSIVDVLEQND